MTNYCPQPQAHPDRCGCKPDAFQIARHSRRLVEQQRERIAALEAECERLRAQCDAILLQARCWAGEAKAQQSITREVGAALGGIPTWGPIAAGVEAMRAERDALAAELAAIKGQEVGK